MKVSTLIQVAALIAIASAPAHAYFINYYPAGFNEGVGTVLKIRSPARTTEIFSQRAIEEPSFASFGFSYSHPSQDHNSFIRNRNVGAKTPGTSSAAVSPATTNQDLQKDSAESTPEISQSNNFSHPPAQGAGDNDLWPIELSDVENLVTAGHHKATFDTDKWTRKPGDENRDIAWSDNPYAPPVKTIVSAAAVPEPASLGLITLGLSALALSRRRAHRKTAE